MRQGVRVAAPVVADVEPIPVDQRGVHGLGQLLFREIAFIRVLDSPFFLVHCPNYNFPADAYQDGTAKKLLIQSGGRRENLQTGAPIDFVWQKKSA
jgi:hypothetical protein